MSKTVMHDQQINPQACASAALSEGVLFSYTGKQWRKAQKGSIGNPVDTIQVSSDLALQISQGDMSAIPAMNVLIWMYDSLQ